MKKILLSLLCLVGFIAANADEVALVADGATYSGAATTVTIANGSAGNIVGLSFGNDDVTVTHKQVSSSTSHVNTSVVRWYQGDILTIVPASGVTITKIEASVASGSKGVFSAEIGTVTGDGTKVGSLITWVGSASDAFQLTAVKQVRFSYMLITYTKGEVTKTSAPIITPNGGEVNADTEIAISCATEGASVYYTIDGSEPTTASTLYKGSFKLSAAATIKAIAVAEGLKQSSVVDASFTFPVATIADYIAAANPHKTTITGPVTVVAQSGSYLFLQDATARIVAFGKLSNVYDNGDLLSNIKGTYTLYNGLPEMNVDATSFGEATDGATIEPEEITIEEVSIDNLLAYVKITGVTIPESTSKSFTISDATGSTTMYNSAGITIPTGENLTVIGFISCYKTDVQILPVEIISASGIEVVQSPKITPAGGAIAKTQEITISCPTEGASIYYTLDGTEPSTSSTLYEEAFTLDEECTVKAIAVAEGMANSNIVEATFTFLNDDIRVATFDFTNPGSLTPVQETPVVGAGISVNNVEFTAGDITLLCVNDSTATDCRLWGGTSAVDLRTYKTSTITISATNANIKSIEFAGKKVGDAYLTADKGTLIGAVWTLSDSTTSSVVFTTTKTTNINTITVNYVPTTNGVEEIGVDSDGDVKYYNFQGVEVVNPTNGIFIKVKGVKVSKVYVK